MNRVMGLPSESHKKAMRSRGDSFNQERVWIVLGIVTIMHILSSVNMHGVRTTN